MGFRLEEFCSHYAGGGKADEHLAFLEKKLSVLQQQVTEMCQRSHGVSDMSIPIIEIPKIICCVRKYQGYFI